jgi:uncharacterized zinc-type alcohol dehydrogenase-like protein
VFVSQAWQITEPHAPLRLGSITRRELRDDDVEIEVLFCGVCGTDVHARDADSVVPLVPGHEFTGRVVEAGRDVRSLRLGQMA